MNDLMQAVIVLVLSTMAVVGIAMVDTDKGPDAPMTATQWQAHLDSIELR